MNAIYLEDSYLKVFDATVESAEGNHVTLNNTAFYPQSGGQPSDFGSFFRKEEEFKVLGVEIIDGHIVHIVDKAGLILRDNIRACLDWDRRYRLMCSHTACHILSSVIFRETKARITGNQIDLYRSRVDFNLEKFDKTKVIEYVEEVNQIIRENLPVRTKLLLRAEALVIPDLFRLAMDVPDREEIRVVYIEGVDFQACGGTHVKNTGEIKGIRIVKAENKGKANRRIYFSLEN